jgi:hypothetical protein
MITLSSDEVPFRPINRLLGPAQLGQPLISVPFSWNPGSILDLIPDDLLDDFLEDEPESFRVEPPETEVDAAELIREALAQLDWVERAQWFGPLPAGCELGDPESFPVALREAIERSVRHEILFPVPPMPDLSAALDEDSACSVPPPDVAGEAETAPAFAPPQYGAAEKLLDAVSDLSDAMENILSAIVASKGIPAALAESVTDNQDWLFHYHDEAKILADSLLLMSRRFMDLQAVPAKVPASLDQISPATKPGRAAFTASADLPSTTKQKQTTAAALANK